MSLDGNQSPFEHPIQPVDVDTTLNTAPLPTVPYESQSCSSTPARILVIEQFPDESQSQYHQSRVADPNPVDLARLIVDEENAGYIVVSQDDIIEENAQPSTPENATLFSLFSRPVDEEDPRARYLLCPKDDLPDFTDWFSEQQHDPTLVPGRESLIDTDPGLPLTSEDKTVCQTELISTFQPWEQSQQRLAAMTLYCAAHSFCDLAKPELIAAVRIGMKITSRTTDLIHDSDQFTSHVESCINDMSQFFVQRAGKLVFKNEKMKIFIRQLKLPDIQPGHATMTRICFQQIKDLGAALVFHPWHRFGEWFGSMSKWPLVGYVVKNWFLHYRKTIDRADIDSELYHLLREGALVQMPAHPSMHVERRIVDAGLGISQIYGLPGLEAVLRNMGARTALATTSVLGKSPTKSQRMRMIAEYENLIASHDSSRNHEIEMCEDNVDGLVMVQFRDLSLHSNTATDETSPIDTYGAASATPNAYTDQNTTEQSITTEQNHDGALHMENDWDELDTLMVDEISKL